MAAAGQARFSRYSSVLISRNRHLTLTAPFSVYGCSVYQGGEYGRGMKYVWEEEKCIQILVGKPE